MAGIGTRFIPPGQTDVYEIVGIDQETGNLNVSKVDVDRDTGESGVQRLRASFAGWDTDSQLEAWKRIRGENNVRVGQTGNIETLDPEKKQWVQVDEEGISPRDFYADPSGVTIPMAATLAATGASGMIPALRGLGAKIAFSSSTGATIEGLKQAGAETLGVQDNSSQEIMLDVLKEGALYGAVDLGLAGAGKGIRAAAGVAGPFVAKIFAGAEPEMLQKMIGELGPTISTLMQRRSGQNWLEVGNVMKSDLREAAQVIRSQFVQFREGVLEAPMKFGGKSITVGEMPVVGKYELPVIGDDLVKLIKDDISTSMPGVAMRANKALGALKAVREAKTLKDLVVTRQQLDEGLGHILGGKATKAQAGLAKLRSKLNESIYGAIDDAFPAGDVGKRWKEFSDLYSDKYTKLVSVADDLDRGVLEADVIKAIESRFSGPGGEEIMRELSDLLTESGIGNRSMRLAEASDLADFFSRVGSYKSETPVGRYAAPAATSAAMRTVALGTGAAVGMGAGAASAGMIGGALGSAIGAGALFALTRPKVIGGLARGIGRRRGFTEASKDLAEALGVRFSEGGLERAIRMVDSKGKVVLSPHGAVKRPSAEEFAKLGGKAPSPTKLGRLNELASMSDDAMADAVKKTKAADVRSFAKILNVGEAADKPSALRDKIIQKISSVPESEATAISTRAAKATAERESAVSGREVAVTKEEAAAAVAEKSGLESIPQPNTITEFAKLEVPKLMDYQIHAAAKKTLGGKLRHFKVKIEDAVEYGDAIVPGKLVGDTVHINRNMVKNAGDVQTIVAHEIIGHRGVHALLKGKQLQRLVNRVEKSFPDRIKSIMDAGEKTKEVAAEEVIAQLTSESLKSGSVPKGAARILADAKSQLRQIFGRKVNDSDLLLVLDYARKVEEGTYRQTVGRAFPARLGAQAYVEGD